MLAWRKEYIHANGIRLWTEQQGEYVPLVLCHGGPGACDNLAPVAEMIEDIARVYRYDQRGCGKSDATPPYDLNTYLADLDALRIAWNHERWIVAGHSWGASLALAYALRHTGRIAGLILISTNGLEIQNVEYERNCEAKLSFADSERLQKLRCLYRNSSSSTRESIQEEILQLKLKADLADPATAIGFPHFPCRMNYSVNRLLTEDWEKFLQQENIEKRIKNLTMPALIVHGTGDPRPPRGALRLANLLPLGEFVSLPNVGHYPWLERPTLLKNALRTFIKRFEE